MRDRNKNMLPVIEEFPIDESTGMPAVAYKQFWRVSQTSVRQMRLELRQREGLGGSRVVGSIDVMEEFDWKTGRFVPITSEQIRAEAIKILEKIRDAKLRKAQAEELLGEYPPKRMP